MASDTDPVIIYYCENVVFSADYQDLPANGASTMNDTSMVNQVNSSASNTGNDVLDSAPPTSHLNKKP